VVLYGEFDLTNGFSTPLPFNTIGIFLAPPDEGDLLENSAWLDLLVTHELTHVVHLDKVRGAPRVLQWIFGREPFFFPNAWQPTWAIEGLAVLNESEPGTGRGRLYGPWFEGWLRAERARGFISLAEINSNGRALPLSKQYIYGAYFYDFLARVYGKDGCSSTSIVTAATSCRACIRTRKPRPARPWTRCGPNSWPTWRAAWTNAPQP
jgi:hypothetical protein